MLKMCADVKIHIDPRNIKSRISISTLIISNVAFILALINIIYVSFFSGEGIYSFYFNDFFVGKGAYLALGIFSFTAYTCLLGAYVAFGINLNKLTELTFHGSDKSRWSGILLIIGACFEGIQIFLYIFGYIVIGNYFILIAALFYLGSFIFLFQVFNSLQKIGWTTKNMIPVLLATPLILLAKAITLIAMIDSYGEFITYKHELVFINSALSIAFFTIVAAVMFLFYKTVKLDEITGQQYIKSTTESSCPNCGNSSDIDAVFCSNCGKSLSE